MSESVDLLADLTPDQQAAVTHGEGPLLILAGAGSGKTRVITRRVAYLLKSGRAAATTSWRSPSPTRPPARCSSRVETLVPGNRVWVSTFHSLGARLLRQYADRLGFDRNFTIYDMDDRNKLVKDALEAGGIDNVKFTPGPDRRGDQQGEEPAAHARPQYAAARRRDFFSQTVAQVYPAVREAAAGRERDGLRRPAVPAGDGAEERTRNCGPNSTPASGTS